MYIAFFPALPAELARGRFLSHKPVHQVRICDLNRKGLLDVVEECCVMSETPNSSFLVENLDVGEESLLVNFLPVDYPA